MDHVVQGIVEEQLTYSDFERGFGKVTHKHQSQFGDNTSRSCLLYLSDGRDPS